MHVLILALRRRINNTKVTSFFFWLNGFLIVLIMILRKKERWRKPSCPAMFWLLKKANKTFDFLRMFLLVKDKHNL